MKTLASLLIILSTLSSAHAAQSTFSADGKKIYLLSSTTGNQLHAIDVASHKSQIISPIKNMGENSYVGIARNPQGEILLATDQSLSIWNTAKNEAQKFLDFPKGLVVTDMSCALGKGTAPTGTLFILGSEKDEVRNKLYACLPGTRKWKEVFCRRNDPYAAPQTNAAGRMFCASNFDLWETAMVDDQSGEGNDSLAGTLTGCRIAPLAMMNTDSSNSGAMVVNEVAIAGHQVFTTLQGRHMGAILQVSAPVKSLYPNPEGNAHPELVPQYKVMLDCLASCKVHYDGGPCDGLSSHEINDKEYLVFWRQNLEGERKWMLLKSGQKAQVIGNESQQ